MQIMRSTTSMRNTTEQTTSRTSTTTCVVASIPGIESTYTVPTEIRMRTTTNRKTMPAAREDFGSSCATPVHAHVQMNHLCLFGHDSGGATARHHTRKCMIRVRMPRRRRRFTARDMLRSKLSSPIKSSADRRPSTFAPLLPITSVTAFHCDVSRRTVPNLPNSSASFNRDFFFF